MIVEAGFVNHWKTEALGSVVGVEAALRGLLQLWGYCQTRKAWEFQLTPLKLAGICGFKGDAQVLWDTMRELAFIDPTDELGWFQVHEWGQMNAGLVGQWAGGARVKGATWHPRGFVLLPGDSKGGRTSGSTRGETSGSAPASGSASASGGSDRIGEDRIGEDRIGEEAKATPVVPRGTGSSGSGSGSKPGSRHRSADLPMPEGCSPEREASLREWLAYRTDLKKPYKPTSWTKLMTQLAVLDDGQLKACVDASIANQWTGLFPDRFTSPGGTCPDRPWSNFREKKDGAAGPLIPEVPKIEEAGFPWREFARDHNGEELVGTWEEQSPRTRKRLREDWSGVSAQTKAAFYELAKGGGSRGDD